MADKEESPLLDTELVPMEQFEKTLSDILRIPKKALDEEMRKNPPPPQKRGRKPKEAKQ